MRFFIIFIFIPFLLFSISVTEPGIETTKEEFLPWFTGPLIAGSGKTCPKNHYVIQPYLFSFYSNSVYDNSWNSKYVPSNTCIQPTLLYLFGITSWMDCQVVGSANINFCRNKTGARISDTSLNFGFQVLEDNQSTWNPDLRIVFKQDFPSGHYKNLNPDKDGTDASGSGFYRIGAAANFQKLFHFKKALLRSRFNITYKISPTTFVEGFNVFGGGYGTLGHIDSVHYFSADLAFEYTLTQNFTFAIDIFYENQSKGGFKGKVGLNKNGTPSFVQSPSSQRLSLAPALEYNFSNDVGIIAGSWFTVTGKNTPQFASGIISLNYYH